MGLYEWLYRTIVAVRIFSPVLIFVNAGWAAVINFLLDLVDGGVACRGLMREIEYQKIDKLLDWWWFVFILGWIYMNMNSYFLVMFILFLWRTVGEMMFFGSGKRRWLVVFPNFFEFTFFVVLGVGGLSFGWGMFIALFCVGREYLIHTKHVSARRILGLPVNWVK